MWTIEQYNDYFLAGMLDMTIEYYGSDNDISNERFLIHEYFSNPIGDAIISLAYDVENKIIAGQYVITPQRFKYFNQEIKAVQSLNTLTREAYRGQGIFTKLAENSYKIADNNGYGFCYGAPNPNSFPGFIKKLEFAKLLEMPLFVKPLLVSKMVREKTNAFLGFLSCFFNLFTLQKSIIDSNIVQVNGDNVFLMDLFWGNVKNKYNIIGVRNSDYISYRYLNVPLRNYLVYFYLVDGKPIAFCVGRIRKVANMTTGMIADFLYVDGFEREATKLVKFMTKQMKKLGAGLSGCIMLNHCNETKILKKAGFVKCPKKLLPQPTPLIIRIFDQKLAVEDIMDGKNWFFTTGDYDVV